MVFSADCKDRLLWKGLGRGLMATLMITLMACSPSDALNSANLLRGARAETYLLSHGALCARLPTLEAVDQYSRNQLPDQSAVSRHVKAWDLSGLLDFSRSADGAWIMLPSEGLKKLKGVHFRRAPGGENDALCFGRLWIERVIDYQQNKPFGVEDAVTVRLEASLKDSPMLKYFKGLPVEPFDPNIFTLSTGSAYAEMLLPSFGIEMGLKPTPTGWYLAKGAMRLGAIEP